MLFDLEYSNTVNIISHSLAFENKRLAYDHSCESRQPAEVGSQPACVHCSAPALQCPNIYTGIQLAALQLRTKFIGSLSVL